MRRLTTFLAIAMTLALIAAACGGGDDDTSPATTAAPTAAPTAATAPTATTEPAAPTGVSTVNVELSEFSISLDATVGGAGEITFVTTNAGALPHEFVILRSDLAPDALPVDTATAKADEAATGGAIGRIPQADLGSGASTSVSINLAPGNYVLICNISGHYQSGMTAAFTVQ